MKDPKDLSPDFSDLRRRAEERLEAESISPEALSPAEAARLIHELQVHQIELELQNEELRQAQVQLAESRDKYADLYDFAPVGYLTLGKAGKILEANLTAATMLGLERSKLLGLYFSHLLMETDRRILRQLLNNSFDQPERRGEFHLQDGNGGVRTMLLDILFLQDAEGQERRRVAMTDITELKRTQEELRLHKEDLEELVASRTTELFEVNEQLREANENLQALFEAAPLAIGVFDAEGKVVNVNPAIERIFGWSKEEFEGRLPLSMPAEPDEETIKPLQRVLRGESFTGVEIKQQRKDGALIDVSISAAPLHDAAGRIRGFIGLAGDITERKRTEEAVRTQARVLESMAEAVTVTDNHGNIQYTNPAFDATFGYKPGELLGQHSNVLNFYPPEENTRVVKEILSGVKSTGVWSGEFRNCKKNGNPFYTSARISAIEVGGKKLFISVQEDITERKRAGEMLRRQAELLDLAHDAIVVRDPKGRITYWNQGATHHYGWPKEVALGKNYYKLFKTAFPQPLPEIEGLLLEQGYWEGELTHTNLQGQRLVMNSRWTLKRDDEGQVVAILEISQDITAQKQIEKEVHRLASFPLLNPNPVLEVDEQGKVIYANPAARQVAERLRLHKGVQAFLPADLKDIVAAARKGGPREYTFDQNIGKAIFAVTLHLPHDLPTVRLYAKDVTERRQADEALRRSEHIFRRLAEANLVGVGFGDSKGNVTYVNDEMLRMMGHSRADFEAGRINWADSMAPEYRTSVAQQIKQLRHEGQISDNELAFLRPDGTRVPFLGAAALVDRDEDALVVVALDLTEINSAEQALRESQEDLSRAQAVAHTGSWRMNVRKNELTWSDENHRIFGIPKGTPLTYESFLDTIHPEDREFVDQKWMGALKGEPYDIEHRIIVDGLVKWVRERAELELDEHGQLLGGFGTTQDITEHRRAQEALLESEERYRSLFENSHAAMLVIDPHTADIVDANPAACTYYGYSREELLAKKITDINTLTPEEISREMQRAKAEECKYFEFKHRLASGEIRDVEVFSGPIRIKGRDLLYSIVHDDTARKQAEAAITQAKEEWERTFDAVTDYIAILDREHRITRMNRAMAELLGKAPEELIGQPCYKVIHGLDEAPDFCPHSQVVATGQEQFEEVQEFGRIFAVNVSPLFGFDGQLQGSVHVARDITERKQAEEALRESEARFRSLFESMTEGVALHEIVTDDQGTAVDYSILATNPAFTIHTGLKPEQVQGQLASRAYGADEAPYLEIFARVADLGEPISFDTFFPPLQRYFSISATSPKPGHFVTVFEDITARKGAEEALRQSEARYRAVGELIPFGIWTANAEGGVEYVSQSFLRMTGKTLEECQGFGWMYLLPQEDINPAMEAWENCLETRDFWDYEHKIRGKDGSYRTILSRGLPLADSQGHVTSWVGINLDITERKGMEEALRQAHNELEERVAERTAALRLANEQLLWEIEERQEVEDRLRESEARFTAFMKHLPGLAVMRDVQGRYVFANEGWEQMMGKTGGEWQSKTLEELWPQEIARKYQQLDQQVLLAGEPLEALEDIEMADGPHHFLTYRFPIRDLDGLPYMVGAIGIDVTARQRAEEALATERQRFFSLLENLPAFIYLQDKDYVVKFANRQFRKRFGEPNGRTCYTLLWGREEPCPECPSFQIFHTGMPVDWEWQGSDGRTYQIYDYPFEDVDGSPLVLEMGIDITAKKQAEEEARHQTRLFEAFFDHAITPLVFLDAHFNFIRVNQAYADSCHQEVGEFAGCNHFDLYPHAENKAIFQEVVQTKQPFVAVAKAFEFPDHPEWGISYWDWSLVPILNESGEVDFLVYSLNDVTEQVHAEEERRRLVEILENTPDFVGIADFYGRLQYLNRSGRALVGVGQDESIGQLRVLQLHPDWVGELILKEGAPRARQEGSWQMESALLHRDGEEIPVSQVILAHKDATGRVQFFSTIARDISDLKQAQENILRQSAILNGINRIFREALTSETEEELARTCLAVAEELTDSRFAFINALNNQGTFDVRAFSVPGWDRRNMSHLDEPPRLEDIKPVGLLARPIQEGQTVLANDPSSHPDAAGLPAGYPPLTAYLGVPLISGDRTLGLIGLGNKPGGYSRDDQGTVETLAPSIVEALMHHQAKGDLQRSESRLRHLADQLLTAQENERKRLAAELHDELGHALLTLKLALSSIAKELLPGQESIAQEVQEQLAFINDVIGEVRRLYHDLSPGDVEDLGLTKALQTLIEDFATHQPRITWMVDLPDLEGLFSQPVQTIIYRLIQEALTNIGKHANPEHVNISAVKDVSQVHFTTEDDGVGFDMVEVLESASGLGLAAMEERLNMIGGSFVVWSKKEEGTRLSFSIPTLPEVKR
jgi:PAS domain S-box-containing protein